MANKLKNYTLGRWIEGDGPGTALHHAISGEELFFSTSKGLDFGAALDYGRKNGSKLRKMTFHERARMLKALALHLNEKKKNYYHYTC